MNLTPITLQQLIELPSTETLVLTVNNRYARRVLEALKSIVRTQQRTLAIPDIMPLGAWLAQLSDELCFVPAFEPAAHVLDRFAVDYLWEQTIRDCEKEATPLLDMRQAARLAADADQLMDEWEVTVVPGEETTDYTHFLNWRAHYQQRIRALDYDDANRATGRVQEALTEQALTLNLKHVVLVGFHEYSPRLSVILEALTTQGAALASLEFATSPAHQINYYVAQDATQEWRMALHWAAEQVRADPSRCVAVVGAELESNVPLVHRILAQACQGTEHSAPLAWNVAVGRSLSDWPLAHAALSWLAVLAACQQAEPLTPELVGRALLAGGCAGSLSERHARAQLDAYWRKQEITHLSTAEFNAALNHYAPQLAAAWHSAWGLMAAQPSQQSAADWIDFFRQWLMALGFPGEAALDSHSFQVMEALDSELGRFARQSPVLTSLSLFQAQTLLDRMVAEAIFQPQRDPKARIDVLGLLEAEGGRWDAVWVVGLTDEVLPAVVKPNPLLPISALRRANAPRATPERELAWAEVVFRSLQETAPILICSYPRYAGDQLLRPSPLLNDIADEYTPTPIPPPSPAEVEWLSDHWGPPLQTDQLLKGGVNALDTQARSPLWAFVKYRLHAQGLRHYARIGAANKRGSFLHAVLERFWQRFTRPDKDSLQDFLAQADASTQLAALIDDVADQYLDGYSAQHRALECERSLIILQQWLEVENAREDFVVHSIEEDLAWSAGSLQLKMRVDRVDELADGRLVIVDYKTSATAKTLLSSWVRTRPIDLQLPIYAAQVMEQGAEVGGLALGWLNRRSPGFIGYGDMGLGVEGIVCRDAKNQDELPPWSQQIQQWQQAVAQLAEELCSGYAAQETTHPDDLRYCDARPFLRLNEAP